MTPVTVQRKAAVDDVDRAGGEGGFVGGEIDRERRDLLRRAEPAHRLALDKGRARAASVPPGNSTPCIAMRSSSDGVATVPGQIALQRMPWVMKSAATALVSPITAALVAP